MIGLDEILGHDRARATLSKMFENRRVPHSLLLHGPEGVGKATIARILSRALICKQGGCGSCSDCHLFDAGNHPDFVRIKRELRKDSKTELRKQIVIDQIRELSRLIGLAPRLGARRVFLIDPADRMNIEAQNALLKTLEEPPPSATLLLVAARPQVLVSTVRSRCFALGLGPLRAIELTRLLEARGIKRAEALARAGLAEGRPGRALELDLDALRERREFVLGGLQRLACRRDLTVISQMGAAFAGKDETALQTNLDLLLALLRDAARSAAGDGSETLVHADLGARLADLGLALGSSRIAELIVSIDKLRDQLKFNINRTLVAEAILAAIAGGPLP